ncbi:hypothetical protein P9112_003636 [Eukaryota sp. TZLM1-RC]
MSNVVYVTQPQGQVVMPQPIGGAVPQQPMQQTVAFAPQQPMQQVVQQHQPAYPNQRKKGKGCLIFLIVFVVAAVAAVAVMFLLDSGDIVTRYEADASGTGIFSWVTGTYAVDTVERNFVGSASVPTLGTHVVYCVDGGMSYRALGMCTPAISFNCSNVVATIAPEIPADAQNTQGIKSTSAGTCTIWESGSNTWCRNGGWIYERCAGPACIEFTNHKRVGRSAFDC